MNWKIIILITALCSLFTNSVSADVWAEREALANIEKELVDLEALVNSAKNRSNERDRTTFDYQYLLHDLRKIREGIAQHLSVPMEPVMPGDIDALAGSYTEHKL